MIYTAIAYRMKDDDGIQITPEVIEKAGGPNPHAAMERLAIRMGERDTFANEIAKWVVRNSAMLRSWIEEDDSQSYYLGHGRFRYEMQGDR